jgi:predicted AlkP superfamily pyrophosphatase or phosphodiesterase
MKAIEKEELGKDAITDFLTVSFSSTDYVGHIMGPRSMNYKILAIRSNDSGVLNYLDKLSERITTCCFLTADHGGAENVNYLKIINTM